MERSEGAGATAEVRAALVELWGRLAPFWGVSPGAARVFAYLLTRAAPVDADELVEGLALSRGAVSMAVRELEEWGLVRRSKLAGERRELYAPETDLERAVKSIVRTRKRREWDPLLERLREWSPALERERSADAVALRARLEQVEALVALADGMAASFLEGGIVKQLGLKALVLAAERAGKRAAKKRR